MEEQVVEHSPEIEAEQNNTGQEQRQGTNGAQLPTWQYAEGVSGDGEPPEWFMKDKYKSVSEQAKAAHSLRKKLGSRAEDAPEEYSLDYEKLGVDKEDAVLKEFNPFFKEINLPQKDYERIVEKFVEIQAKSHELMEKQRAEAFNAFGPETKEVVGRLNTWANNNFTESERDIIQSFMGSAEEIRVLEKMRAGAPKSSPPTVNQAQNYTNHETLESINREIGQNWDKMNSDENYRRMMHKKRQEAHARERQ